MTGEPQTNLPSSWKLADLCQVAELNPRLDKSAYIGNPMVSFVPMPGVEAGTGAIDVSQTRSLEEVKKGYTPFQEGDVLFAKITPCMENGKMAVVPPLKNGLGFGSTEFHVLRPYCETNAQFIYFFVSSESFRRDAEHNMTGAVGQRRVPTSYLVHQSVPVPPAREQHRIVAKIEELFSELDKGVESLKTARAKLDVYRQVVLKLAFEGKLTAKWREENKDKLETPEQLLARIKQEREARYEQQLQEWKTAVKKWNEDGKSGKKPAAPKKTLGIVDVPDALSDNLAQLPESWRWFRVGDFCEVVRGGSPRPAGDPRYYGGTIPFLKVADLTRKAGVYLDTYSFSIKEVGLHKTRLVEPPILMLSNSGATLGVPKVCRIRTTFNDGIAAFLGLDENDLPYHYYFWASKTLELRAINQGAAQPNLNTSLIQENLIPLCSKIEMQIVARDIERLLSICDELAADIDNQLMKSVALRQSILKKAFSGQLVAQAPRDEPASVLLDRIRAEREMAAKNNRSRKTEKRKTTA